MEVHSFVWDETFMHISPWQNEKFLSWPQETNRKGFKFQLSEHKSETFEERQKEGLNFIGLHVCEGMNLWTNFCFHQMPKNWCFGTTVRKKWSFVNETVTLAEVGKKLTVVGRLRCVTQSSAPYIKNCLFPQTLNWDLFTSTGIAKKVSYKGNCIL